MGLKYSGYLKRFRKILVDEGPFDVLHAHGGISYGPLLKQAYKAGVKARIIHGHNLQQGKKKDLLRLPVHLYYRNMMYRYATLGLACSKDACEALYGFDWQKHERFQVLYYGINLEPYKTRDRSGVRKELGLNKDDVAVCHVGRFMPVKNHKFIVDIAKTVSGLKNGFKFVLIGDGPLRQEIEDIVSGYGLSDRFVFTGLRSDVPRILSGMDIFILPSFHEGFGIVLVEAQAAGLRCLVNIKVPKEVEIIKENCDWLNIEDGAKVWADKIIELSEKEAVDREHTLHKVETSVFNIEKSVLKLTTLYERHFERY
jgi:glycosyltransferase involved in cell wall biosynthesis